MQGFRRAATDDETTASDRSPPRPCSRRSARPRRRAARGDAAIAPGARLRPAPAGRQVRRRAARARRSALPPRRRRARGGARRCARNPRVDYAEPELHRHRLGDAEPRPVRSPTTPARSTAPPSAAAPAAGSPSSGTSSPGKAPRPPLLPTSPGGIDAVGAWRNLVEAGRPGAAGRHRRRPRHRHRLPRATAAGSCAAPTSPPASSSRATTSSTTTACRSTKTATAPTSPGRSPRRPTTAIGLTGLAYRAKLMPVRVLDRHGRGQADEIAKGIRFAVAHHAQVINMSFNFGCGKKVPERRRSAARGLRARGRHGRLGRQPRLGDLRLAAGDRAAA